LSKKASLAWKTLNSSWNIPFSIPSIKKKKKKLPKLKRSKWGFCQICLQKELLSTVISSA
jgi:hypothetical protein